MQAYSSRLVLVRLARAFGQASFRSFAPAKYSEAASSYAAPVFDVRMLEVLICPLSKAPLRWDAASSELICDELGVAYPVVNGIPNLRPADGRIIETGDKEISTNQEAWGNAESTQGSTGAPG